MSSLWLQACAAFRSEDWGTAASSLTKAIDAGAQDAHFFEKRGQARLKMGQHECALGDFGVVMARKDYKAPTSILVDVARCRFHLGSPTSALIAVREAISMEPTHSGAKTLRHRIHELQGHMETYRGAFSRRHWHMARSSFESCLTIYNQEEGHTPIEISCWGVQLYIAERKWDNALTKVTDILRSRSSAVEAMVLHARILFLTAKLLEARKKVLDALKLDPDNDDARKLFSRIKGVDRYKEHGNESFRDAQWSDAVVWWEEALLLLGEDEEEGGGGLLRARLLLNQATANLKLKQCAEGIRHVDASLVLDASYYKAFRTRARLHYELELYEKAAEDFKAAIQYGTSELNARDLRALGDELARAELKAQREKKGKDYYKILGLSRNCTQAEIKKAYHLLSLKHHPDKGGVEEQFKLIVEAYSILSDNDERRKYERKSSSNRDDYEDAQ
ncbi:DnaJ-domain-containing protein [Obba rivulosa]|uniref:DnaJ-domain-containing protein n=1 Tax=Obba rivulosa TaxID=1052685 RepID=A0A8E2J2Q5_9APHY|nr:DnaJ-domain-containing protein [Obba rivulosa]